MINGLGQINSPYPNNTFINKPLQTAAIDMSNPKISMAVDNAVQVNFSANAQIIHGENKQTDKAVNITKNKKPSNNDHQSKNTIENKTELSQTQMNQVQKLKDRDAHVKAHEAAHMAVAGSYARGGPSYQYVMGPDKRQYAVGGEIQLDTSPVPDDPNATIAKAEILRKGALAPSDPSGADLSVAAAASQMEAEARQELSAETQKVNSEKKLTDVKPINNQFQSKISAYQLTLNPPKLGQIINKSA